VRGWRSTWLGAGAGLAVLAVLVLALGTALTTVPIGALRLVVGWLLLVFGLQWLRKGIARVSANGFQGMGERPVSAEGVPGRGVDWTAFVLSFKGVLLEGLLVGTLLSSFGTFWAAEGLGVAWPGGDTAILVLVGWYVLAAAGYIGWRAVPSGPGLGGGTVIPAMRTSATASEEYAARKPGSGCDGNGLILRLKVNALHQ
jgi:uncharacterized membrane protein